MSVDELPRCPLKHRVSAGLRVNKTDPRIHCLDCGLSIAATDWVTLYERWANRESHAELERERDALREALTELAEKASRASLVQDRSVRLIKQACAYIAKEARAVLGETK
jgi:hypothetical protein